MEQSRFSTFDLGDAALSGQAEKAVQILQFLKESGEPESLVLWTLSKEMRLVMQLLAAGRFVGVVFVHRGIFDVDHFLRQISGYLTF